jgi:transcriptional regulator with XRE-family HTH domain
MSPRKVQQEPPPRVVASLAFKAAELGREARAERVRRGLSQTALAAKAGLSTSEVHKLESGKVCGLETYIRVGFALGLDPRFTFLPEAKVGTPRDVDPVHAAMGEIEAAHFRKLGYEVRLDEPYQHYQFAGRADAAVIDREPRALLHLENRTRFPDTQGFLGSWNAKRAYLANDLADRLGIRGGWRSIDHVVVALWSAEVLHSLRLRGETFRSACPDAHDGFATWWAGSPPTPGIRTSLIVFDPLPGQRSSRRRWVGLEDMRSVEPRHRGYAQAFDALKAAGLA